MIPPAIDMQTPDRRALAPRARRVNGGRELSRQAAVRVFDDDRRPGVVFRVAEGVQALVGSGERDRLFMRVNLRSTVSGQNRHIARGQRKSVARHRARLTVIWAKGQRAIPVATSPTRKSRLISVEVVESTQGVLSPDGAEPAAAATARDATRRVGKNIALVGFVHPERGAIRTP